MKNKTSTLIGICSLVIIAIALLVLRISIERLIEKVDESQGLINTVVDNQMEIKEELTLAKYVEVDLTAYVAAPGKKTALVTTPVVGRTVAVSRDLSWMLGKRIYVPQFGVREVKSLTAAGFEKTVDLLVATEEEAKLFGRKKARVVVLN